MLKLLSYLTIGITIYMIGVMFTEHILNKDLLRAILTVFAGVAVVGFMAYEWREELRFRSKKK